MASYFHVTLYQSQNCDIATLCIVDIHGIFILLTSVNIIEYHLGIDDVTLVR